MGRQRPQAAKGFPQGKALVDKPQFMLLMSAKIFVYFSPELCYTIIDRRRVGRPGHQKQKISQAFSVKKAIQGWIFGGRLLVCVAQIWAFI